MAARKKHLLNYFIILLIFTGCLSEEQKDRNAILELFEKYKSALNSVNSAEAVYPLLSNIYLGTLKSNMEHALDAHEKKLRFFDFQNKSMILLLRHKVPVDVLVSGEAKKVIGLLTEERISFLPEDTPLQSLQFASDRVAVGLYNTGFYSKTIAFYKHPKTGLWSIDPRGDSEYQKNEMNKLITENASKGISEEELLRSIIFGVDPPADSVLNWTPLRLKK